jgi:hypothetical protein
VEADFMRTIIFNDTSRFHHGCSAVMRVLHREAERAGLKVLESVYGNTWRFSKSYPVFRPEAMEQAELIIVNGEGTMHDDARFATYYMEEIFRNRGKRRFALVNSLWQRMSPTYAQWLAEADLLVLREPMSHAALGRPEAKVMPDLSYYEVPLLSTLADQGFMRGTFYGTELGEIPLDTTIDIKAEDWGVIVNKLRHARACLTGKHHEVMACCIARCPFVSPGISTHKIASLGAFINAPLVEVAPNASEGAVRQALILAEADPDGVYARLFDHFEELRARMQLSDLLRSLI